MKEELEFLLDSHRSSHLCRLENGRTSPLDIKPFVLPPCEKSSSNDNERVKAQYLINNDKDMFSIPPPSKKVGCPKFITLHSYFCFEYSNVLHVHSTSYNYKYTFLISWYNEKKVVVTAGILQQYPQVNFPKMLLVVV